MPGQVRVRSARSGHGQVTATARSGHGQVTATLIRSDQSGFRTAAEAFPDEALKGHGGENPNPHIGTMLQTVESSDRML